MDRPVKKSGAPPPVNPDAMFFVIIWVGSF